MSESTSEPVSEQPPDPSRLDQVRTYLAVLELTLEPGDFDQLAGFVQEIVDYLAANRDGAGAVRISFDREEHVSQTVRHELLVVLGILLTGRMDQAVLELGDGIVTAVPEDQSRDPARLAEIHRAAVARRAREAAEGAEPQPGEGGSLPGAGP